ncbi:DUF4913 domain-containing protein [Nocardia africana]|uniref:DUF4913 domain-containing protein n=1 Tax=Nocardia africana TaxID=134964 RepID=A0A379X4K1_9NOCA|nr:DUF4913 domain-containing protein [Nocardia africana]MCC3318438.1 DUF4913 domain-containing protein [Nocardia africana]SUH71909.1 Uncharacterised protein [Nocardia africana]
MTTAKSTDDKQPDIYLDAGEWVDSWLAPALEGKFEGGGKGQVVCPEWFRHRMVALRMHALWREWEKANREDTMSSWWVYHFDAHARALFDAERGPMHNCTPEKHRTPGRVNPNQAPAGWFDQNESGPDYRVLSN